MAVMVTLDDAMASSANGERRGIEMARLETNARSKAHETIYGHWLICGGRMAAIARTVKVAGGLVWKIAKTVRFR
jgi:hypothetical protein